MLGGRGKVFRSHIHDLGEVGQDCIIVCLSKSLIFLFSYSLLNTRSDLFKELDGSFNGVFCEGVRLEQSREDGLSNLVREEVLSVQLTHKLDVTVEFVLALEDLFLDLLLVNGFACLFSFLPGITLIEEVLEAIFALIKEPPSKITIFKVVADSSQAL